MGTAVFICRAPVARAEQFVLLDATFDYTWQDAQSSKPSLSHYYVNDSNFLNKARPRDWTAPVDYRSGKLHVRTEVFAKPPGDQQVGWTLCYIPNSGGYGCADTTYYKSTGVFDRETAMTDFWQNEEIDWDQGIKQMDLIYAIDDSGSGHITNHPEVKDLVTPTRVRITMVQVSAGATYDSSMFSGAAGAGGSGAGGSGAGGSAAGGLGGLGGALSAGAAAGASGGVSPGGMGGLLGLGGTPVGGSPPATVGGAPVASGGGGAAGASAPVTPVSSAGNAAAPTAESDGGCSVGEARSSQAGAAFVFGLLLLSVGRRRKGWLAA